MLCKELLKEYLLDLKLRNYSKRTIETYEQQVTKFLEFYSKTFNEDAHVQKVKKLHYKMFIGSLLDRNLMETYINAILKGNKSFYSYAVEEGLIRESPLKDIKFLKEQKKVLVAFSDNEVLNMINVWNFSSFLNARNKVIIATLLDTGIRVSELINLKNEDIKSNYISVLGKGNKWRVVPLSNELEYLINKYIRIRDNHFKKLRTYYGRNRVLEDYLFLGKSGKGIKTVTNIELVIKDTAKKANVRPDVRASPHTFRHYYSLKNLQQGQDIFTISKILGHNNINTTKIYLGSITNEQVIEKAVATSPLSCLL
ncbi:tyrosine-type recombinase/integrase [Enterococcus devriesei]|uniref:tyrosine-type recombinase/integrase n=1 Tax=Enterococcus devriesei TaxID=319970 RepID=UPI0036D4286F